MVVIVAIDGAPLGSSSFCPPVAERRLAQGSPICLRTTMTLAAVHIRGPLMVVHYRIQGRGTWETWLSAGVTGRIGIDAPVSLVIPQINGTVGIGHWTPAPSGGKAAFRIIIPGTVLVHRLTEESRAAAQPYDDPHGKERPYVD